MARREVVIVLPDAAGCPRGRSFLARTDLAGCGNVREGEEFTARELCPWGRNPLMKGGRKLRVRVVRAVRANRRTHQLHVEVLADLTPKDESPELFTTEEPPT